MAKRFVCYAHPGTDLEHVGAPCACFVGGPAPEHKPMSRRLARAAAQGRREAKLPARLDMLDRVAGGAR